MDLIKWFIQRPYYQTQFGATYLGDSLELMQRIPEGTVNLVMTSPPFALERQKEYGNVHAREYVDWFLPFAEQMKRIITHDGSIVIDIGGTWIKGKPERSLYHFKLAIALVEELGLHLAQDFYWYNPAKLPSPAEWVTVRRIRVKDAVNTVWWLSKTPFPKASNRNILRPYSDSMKELLKNGYRAKKRPSGHDISEKFNHDRGGAIPPNLIELANTDSNSSYLQLCRQQGIKPHPARFPHGLPEFFIRFLTQPGDLVVDPFAGSVVTGEVSENLERFWLGFEVQEDYLAASRFRFPFLSQDSPRQMRLGEAATQQRDNVP
ncbi:MAG: site-specific DNA-methyltransferase [Chloroflexota bacterium]|jgi:site-specific DNA-methyltransferase (cytosine-N4-specific)